MRVRREQPGDVEHVRAVVAAAFARPGAPDDVPVEATLLDALRSDAAWLPTLSMVAVDPTGEVVGPWSAPGATSTAARRWGSVRSVCGLTGSDAGSAAR